MDEPRTTGVSLEALVQGVGSAVATVAAAPAGLGLQVGSVALLEPPDLDDRADAAGSTQGELCVVIGATEDQVSRWLRWQSERPVASRVRVVATKISSAELDRVATRCGIALLRIHPRARIDLVLGTVRSLLEGAAQSTAARHIS